MCMLLLLPPLNSSSKARLAATFIMFLAGQPLGELCESRLFVNNEHAPFKDGNIQERSLRQKSPIFYIFFIPSPPDVCAPFASLILAPEFDSR